MGFEYLDHQKRIIMEIYNDLVNDEVKTAVVFGESGVGKHTIVGGIIESLSESWSFHNIIGFGYPSIPESEIVRKKRVEFFPAPSMNISLGIINLGMTLRFQESDGIFNDIEKQFIKEISKSTQENKLIIIENYNNLSETTKIFINTLIPRLMNSSLRIKVLITSENNTNIPSYLHNIKYYEVRPLNIEECMTLFSQFNINESYDKNKVDELYKLTNGNIEFFLNIISNRAIGLSGHVDDIISNRIISICQDDDNLKECLTDLLTLGSYLDQGLSAEQILCLYEKANTLIYLEKLFNKLLKVGLFVKSENKYSISINAFKEYFKNIEPNLASYYYKTLYDYFTDKYDYEYEIRADYYRKYLLSNKMNHFEHYFALRFLCILNKYYCGQSEEIISIEILLSEIPLHLRDIHEKLVSEVYSTLQIVKQIYRTKSKNWEEVYAEIKSLNSQNIIIECEIRRLEIEIFAHCNKSTCELRDLIFSLNAKNGIIKDNYKELTLWIRITNTLLSHSENRANEHSFSMQIKSELTKMLSAANESSISKFYNNIILRKSALFEHPTIALRNIKKSIRFFEGNNVYETYKGLVNALGTSIVNCDYQEAQDSLNKIELLLITNKDIDFPEIDKYECNKLLFKFMSSYDDFYKKGFINSHVVFYEKEFESLHLKNPKSNVIFLNYVSMKVSLGLEQQGEIIEKFLLKNAMEFNEDNFYKFYLNDLKLANYICQEKWDESAIQLEYLKTVEPPQFYNEKYYCEERVRAYTEILNRKIKYDYKSFNSALYDILLKRFCFPGKDKAWKFLSRGFILSDQQFFAS